MGTQIVGFKTIKERYAADTNTPCTLPAAVVDAFRRVLLDEQTTDISLLAYALTLPAETTLMETMAPPIDPVRLHNARNDVVRALAVALKEDLERRYEELSPALGEELHMDGASAGRRRLRNVCLGYLATAKDEKSNVVCAKQFSESSDRGSMTDKLAALACLANVPNTTEAADALDRFYRDAKGDALVLDKWFRMQSCADVDDVLVRVKKLMEHPDFTLTNPNRLRSVVSIFAGNVAGFHKADGSGYEFLAEMILKVDSINSQVASRFATVFSTWRKLDEARQALVSSQLQILNGKKDILSKDTYEVVS